jgi:TraB/PrgY/gumN family
MRCLPIICAVAIAWPVAARSQAPIDASIESVPEEILVTGEFPGPGMWKVMRADDPDQHVLWILGNPPPLPKKMKWKSKEVEAAVVGSQEILLGSSVNVKPDEKIGFFKGLSLLPAALGARKNPDRTKLKDLVEPDVYARWLVQKKKYLGKNNSVESWRPIFAGLELREEAFEDLKMRESGVVSDAVTKLAKDHKIKTTTATIDFSIKTKDIKSKIKQFAKEPLADEACFAMTLDLVEALSDTDAMYARATAWATGDLDGLIAIEPLPNPNIACTAAIMSSQIARDLIPSDIGAQLKAAWLAAAEKSLASNRSTFAFLPIPELTSADGQLAALRAKGYVVEEPQRD